MAKRYSEAYRQEIVERYHSGGSSAQALCAQYGIARSTLFLWCKQYSADETGQVPRERYLMQMELQRLRIENQIFRESGCCPSSPLDMRLNAIHRLKESYSVHALCRVLDVNRSTFYYHELRAPEKTLLEMEDETLKPAIAEIFERSCRRFGARKIRAKLQQKGDAVSERRLLRLMKELGLSNRPAHPKLNSANDRHYRYYPNKLRRNFLTDAPNKVWVSDITYAKVGRGFLYLCVVIDLYSRKSVGYAVSESIDAGLVMKAFQQAFVSRGKPEGLLFHSDRGAQYTALAFREHLRKCGVQQSFSAPGNPCDNAVAESFFASIKKEDFCRNFYRTEEKFRAAVKRYMDFYNDYRPHQSLGFLTPNQAEKAFYDLAER